MLAEVAQEEQQASERIGPVRRPTTAPPGNPEQPSVAPPEQSHLQAVHASKRGVILKGMRHETFWEW